MSSDSDDPRCVSFSQVDRSALAAQDDSSIGYACMFHCSDLDGHCSGALVKLKCPECDMIPMNYGYKIPWERLRGKGVFIVDFSLPIEDLWKLTEVASSVVWIDHHETAITSFLAHTKNYPPPNNLSFALSIGLAGCEITWKTLFGPQEMPYVVRLLGRYDVWDHRDSNVLPFQYGMRHYTTSPLTKAVMHFWRKLLLEEDDSIFSVIIANGLAIKEYEDKQSEAYCRTCSFDAVFDGHRCLAMNRGMVNSRAFESCADPAIHDFVVGFYWKPKAQKWAFSIFNLKGAEGRVHLGELAQKFGGGGHKGAAGFSLAELPEGFLKPLSQEGSHES